MKLNKILIDKLKNKALKLRQDTFQTFIRLGEAHLGGSFSMIEIIISLYERILKKNDIFILSKAHASIPFCLLLRDKGYNTKITTHLELDLKNGVQCTTGSLGHGLPMAVGMALAKKINKKKGLIYVLISDGECQEGTTWESLLIASKHKLDNLIILLDYNKIQALDFLEDAISLNDIKSKFIAFNTDCFEIKNGHSFPSIINIFKKIKSNKRPKVFVFHTIKGKGIKSFENQPMWHAKKIREAEELVGKRALKIK